MARRVLVIAAVLIVAGFLYLGYTSYDAKRAGSNGEVYSNDPPADKSKTDSIAPTSLSGSAPASNIVYPSADQSASSTSNSTAQTDQTTRPGSGTPGNPAPSAPATDSITPNPPNGMAFSGTGKYQLYRQGNITWRLDTGTGHTCIIFATEEEWKKPKVLQAGCGKTR